MKPVTAIDYRSRMDRVLRHLWERIDEDLSVGELAEIAYFSPFHFHRVFRGMTGQSVAGLVRRLRLEVAARALRSSEASVTEIAFAAHYGSSEAFTRAFQQSFGLAPSDYRLARPTPRFDPPLSLELMLDPTTLQPMLEPLSGGSNMEVVIETFPDRLAVCLRHVGPYDQIGPTFGRLIGWARGTGVATADSVVMGLSYDDPETVALDQLRSDAAISVAAPCAVPEGGRLATVRGGRYAVHLMRGPYSGINEVFRRLFGKWLPASGEELADRPCLEIYLNDPFTVPENELMTKICLPLRDLP